MKGIPLKFTKGQIVVHPHHGPATVKKIASRTLRDEKKQYLTLVTHQDEMSVAVPVDLAEEMGVRPLMDAEGVMNIFEILAGESSPFDKVWSRRFKDYTERLNSGDVIVTAGLVRDITRRNHESRVSYGEMGVLRDATGPLVAELALALDTEPEVIEGLMEKAILEGELPKLGKNGLVLAG